MEITIDYVKDHFCCGCKYAFLLPKKSWTLMRRLGCKGAKQRIKLLTEAAKSAIDDSNGELQNRDLAYAREYLSEAIELGLDTNAKGWCDVAGMYNPPPCMCYDEEAKVRLLEEWDKALEEG